MQIFAIIPPHIHHAAVVKQLLCALIIQSLTKTRIQHMLMITCVHIDTLPHHLFFSPLHLYIPHVWSALDLRGSWLLIMLPTDSKTPSTLLRQNVKYMFLDQLRVEDGVKSLTQFNLFSQHAIMAPGYVLQPAMKVVFQNTQAMIIVRKNNNMSADGFGTGR